MTCSSCNTLTPIYLILEAQLPPISTPVVRLKEAQLPPLYPRMLRVALREGPPLLLIHWVHPLGL